MEGSIMKVSIDILKIHPRNTEFFDDIAGEDYENFKNSIKEEGIISEIIVAPDMTIISGHQRYKAAKELGIKMVPVRVREDLVDEDKKLKILLASNFGRVKNDEKKRRKVAVEYIRLCGYTHGEIGKNHVQSCLEGNSEKLSLDEIAKQLGTSKRNLSRALSIERNLTESMKELLDTGVITKNLAADTIASLSYEEQEELVSKLDATKKYTQKQVKEYIDKIKNLEKELKEKETKVIDNTDYKKINDLRNKVEKMSENNNSLTKKINEVEAEKKRLQKQLELYKEDSERYNKLKSDIDFLSQKKSNLSRQVDSATELAGLTVQLQHVLENDLAPIKFKRCMEILKSDDVDEEDVCIQNLEDIIYNIEEWIMEMKSYLPKGHNDVIVDYIQ